MRRYDSYKDSGVEWIGEIPEGWEVKRLKYVFREHSGNGFPNDMQGNTDGTIPFYKVSDLNGVDTFVSDSNNYVTDEDVKTKGWNLIPSGTIVTAKIGESLRKNHRKICKLECIIDNNCLGLEPISICSKYSYYLLMNVDFDWFVNPGAVPSISMDKLRNFILPLSTTEQTAIASFLDRKTAEIDQLIANKEKLVALYEEEKTAIINRAVTKGLDPAVKTRPSGVDWLGDIPEQWEVKRLKYVIKSITGGGTPSTGNPLFWNGTIPWVSPKDMKNAEISETEDYVTDLAVANSSTTLVAPNSILVVVRSGILKHTFPVAINRVTVCLNQDMKAIIPADCLDEKFLYWKLKGLSNIVLTVCNKMGATVDSIEVPDLLSLLVTFPQKAEQTAIVTHIETECARLDAIIARFKKQIELFKEYRTTLISEVVTGKIDVRGEVGV